MLNYNANSEFFIDINQLFLYRIIRLTNNDEIQKNANQISSFVSNKRHNYFIKFDENKTRFLLNFERFCSMILLITFLHILYVKYTNNK